MTFNRTVELPVSPDEAFALVTEPERLRRWQTVSAYVDLRAGGSYRWIVVPGHTASGTYREVEPGRRVVFGWGWEDNEDLPPDASTVIVTVEPSGAGSRVTLVHEGLNAAQEASHAEGWNHFLDRLERLAATGDAGADEWAWAPENLDPVIAADAVLAGLQPVLRGLTEQDRDRPGRGRRTGRVHRRHPASRAGPARLGPRPGKRPEPAALRRGGGVPPRARRHDRAGWPRPVLRSRGGARRRRLPPRPPGRVRRPQHRLLTDSSHGRARRRQLRSAASGEASARA